MNKQYRSKSHASTSSHISFWHHLPKNDIPTYAHFSIHITIFIQHFLNSIFLNPVYLMLNSACSNSCFTVHFSMHTNALMNFFTLGFKQLAASTLTHISRYRPFITNGVWYINKISHHNINKTTLEQHFQIWLIILSHFFTHILTNSDPVFSRGPGVGWLRSDVTWISFPPDMIHSLPTFWLNVMSSSHDSVLCLNTMKLFPCQNVGAYLSFQ